ncbi:hypothetical protein KEM56_006704 [Ascosphaera pollenicola]|nr:hypothetical protein KEM56_006704 [Ascosphaera pollenicola]
MADPAFFRMLNPSPSGINFSNVEETLGDRWVLRIHIGRRKLNISKTAWELVAPAQVGGMQRQGANVWTLRLDAIDQWDKIATLVNFGNNDEYEPCPVSDNLQVYEAKEYLERQLDYLDFAATWAGSYRFFFAVADQIATFCRRHPKIENVAGVLQSWVLIKSKSDYLRDELLSIVFERLNEFACLNEAWGMQLVYNGFWKEFIEKFGSFIKDGAILYPFENAWLPLDRGALRILGELMRGYNFVEVMQNTTEAMQATTIADAMDGVE